MSDFSEKAAAFASHAAGKARQFAKFTADKTKKLSRIAKLNMDISSQRDAKRRVFTDIGRIYYESGRNPSEEEIAPLFAQIDEILGNIAEMEDEIAALKAEPSEEAGDDGFESVVEADEQSAGEDEIVVEITEPEPEESAAPAEPEAPAEAPCDYSSCSPETTEEAASEAPAEE